MDAAVAAGPLPKKRGRPRKVVSEDASAEPGVRQASMKRAVAEKKEAAAAPKKVAKRSKTTTTTTTTKTTAAAKATKTTNAATPSKTVSAPGAAAPTESASAHGTAEQGVETLRVAGQPTPVTPSTSRILEEVYKTNTVKPPPPPPASPSPTPAPQEILLPTGGAANVVIEQSLPPTATKTAIPANPTPKPTPTPTPTPTPAYTPPRPAPLLSRTTIPNPIPNPKTTTTTIPLPTHPLNPSQPATPRPKPISPAALEKAAIERDINEGRMPPKYRGAARRVTTIMVGIPVILVVGWDLYKRWDGGVRKKFGEGEVGRVK
ncbi:hypothetical protein PMIN06_010768 [Paraphaeosphaeria minitans]